VCVCSHLFRTSGIEPLCFVGLETGSRLLHDLAQKGRKKEKKKKKKKKKKDEEEEKEDKDEEDKDEVGEKGGQFR